MATRQPATLTLERVDVLLDWLFRQANDPDRKKVNQTVNNTTCAVSGPLSSLPSQMTQYSGYAAETSSTYTLANAKLAPAAITQDPNGTYSATRTLVSADVNLVTTTGTPDWVDAGKGTVTQQGEWSRFDTALKGHEGTHQNIQLGVAQTIDTNVDGLSASGTGATPQDAVRAANKNLDAAAKNVMVTAIKAGESADQLYDALTSHGATEGAVLESPRVF